MIHIWYVLHQEIRNTNLGHCSGLGRETIVQSLYSSPLYLTFNNLIYIFISHQQKYAIDKCHTQKHCSGNQFVSSINETNSY